MSTDTGINGTFCGRCNKAHEIASSSVLRKKSAQGGFLISSRISVSCPNLVRRTPNHNCGDSSMDSAEWVLPPTELDWKNAHSGSLSLKDKPFDPRSSVAASITQLVGKPIET